VIRLSRVLAMFVVFVLVASAIAFPGTLVSKGAAQDVPTGGTLRLGWLQEQDTLNPFVTVTVQGKTMLKLLYDNLVIWNKTLEPVAHLAETWTSTADSLNWTFQLVDNAKWSDGTDLTAADVKFTFDLIKDEQLSAYYSNVKFMSSVTTNGDYEVTVEYSQAIATVLSDLATVPIVPEHIWTGMNKSEIALFTNDDPIGSGPFVLDSWTKGVSVVLDSNPDYWDGAPYIEKAVFQKFSNTETLVNALRNGEIDIIPKELPPTSIALLNADDEVKVTTNTDLYYREISINVNENGAGNPTLRDLNVRLALSMAVDKQALIDLVHLGYAEPGTTIVQKAASYWWDSSIEPYPFDIPAANALLNDSGYMDIDDDGIRESPNGTVEMSYTLLILQRWPEEMRTGQQLQTWWGELGVELTVTAADANTINSYIYPEYSQDMFIWGYSGQPDPAFSLLIMLSNEIQNWNDCGYANATYDALYDDMSTATDVEDRRSIIYEMQGMVYDDCPYIVLYYMQATGAYRLDTFAGFVNMPTGLLSDLNPYTLREVHLIEAEEEGAQTDYVPWAIAGVAIIVAVAAVAFAMMKAKKAPPKE